MTDLIINGATLALVIPLLGTLCTCVVVLYRMLIGRLTRAENQVDKGFGSLEKLTNTIELSGKGIVALASEMAAMKVQHDAMKIQNDSILERVTALERRRGA